MIEQSLPFFRAQLGVSFNRTSYFGVGRFCCLPNASVWMLAAGIPFSTRKRLVRSTRRSESA